MGLRVLAVGGTEQVSIGCPASQAPYRKIDRLSGPSASLRRGMRAVTGQKWGLTKPSQCHQSTRVRVPNAILCSVVMKFLWAPNTTYIAMMPGAVYIHDRVILTEWEESPHDIPTANRPSTLPSGTRSVWE